MLADFSATTQLVAGLAGSGLTGASSAGSGLVVAATPATAGSASLSAPVSDAALILRMDPTLRLDASLGLIVMEFHDADGSVSTSLPSEKQLALYRTTMRIEGALEGASERPAEPATASSATLPAPVDPSLSSGAAPPVQVAVSVAPVASTSGAASAISTESSPQS